MINKKNLWFLTLFSLVLVLSIYYVTMPSEVFTKEKVDKEEKSSTSEEVDTSESSIISALKVEDDSSVLEKINSLKEKLTDSNISTEEKIKESCSCDNFVKIDGDNIRVVLDSDDASTTSANNIMRLVQNEFDEKMYISVKFN